MVRERQGGGTGHSSGMTQMQVPATTWNTHVKSFRLLISGVEPKHPVFL